MAIKRETSSPPPYPGIPRSCDSAGPRQPQDVPRSSSPTPYPGIPTTSLHIQNQGEAASIQECQACRATGFPNEPPVTCWTYLTSSSGIIPHLGAYSQFEPPNHHMAQGKKAIFAKTSLFWPNLKQLYCDFRLYIAPFVFRGLSNAFYHPGGGWQLIPPDFVFWCFSVLNKI